jgi:hypothetical protein
VTHCPVGVDVEGCEGYVSFLLFFDHLCLLTTNSDLRAIQPPSWHPTHSPSTRLESGTVIQALKVKNGSKINRNGVEVRPVFFNLNAIS